MQNTKVRGGRTAGEKMKLGVREKNEKGEIKKEENYIKKGERNLKNASPWAIAISGGRWKRSKCILHSPLDRLKTLKNGVKTHL